MNCPYCDESVHLMSKFCPKCGLPLKDDATVMGAYASDDTGPSLYVIAGGAAAVLAVAVGIGWLSSRGDQKQPIQQVQRQQMSNPLAVPGPAAMPGSGFSSGFSYGTTAPSAPSANYSPQVKWAYTPPPVSQPAQPQPVFVPEPRGPEAPTHNLVQEMRQAPKRPPVVMVARATAPEIPSSAAVPAPPTLGPGQVLIEPTSVVVETPTVDPIPRLTPEGQELERAGIITWDPVQERYVIVPGRGRRPTRFREIAPRSPAPTNVEGQ